MYIVLWGLTLYALWYLYREHYRFREDWNFQGLKRSWRNIWRRFLPFAAMILAFTILVVPESLFSLPLQRPRAWLWVMFLYPVLSVLPQEIIYRSLFFRRYRDIWSADRLCFISALAFGWMHILLQNTVAVLFSFVGGLLFAQTYQRTKSLAAASAEHALYGCYIFSLGLGVYFYHGLAVK